ncbi:hypothetical protein [Actinoplanes auranticolor]|uniref:Uncharacterized protein n=1 Tax=Actinoplanes auranticolor TaxID=47988 RepID=A0A919VUL8_9ACTN|nr:hypothetical protein [Actinoplanes auranticolor]GIM79554.1 hypothetical protein Aau02nite_86360 [Actinoplanes auranticolor]
MTVLAHGVGQSQDLPLPLDLVLQAGAATVVVSFLVVAVWWKRPRLAVVLDRPVRESRLRWLVLAVTVYLVGNALFGPQGPENPAGHALFVWVWVGLVPVSVVFGPVWRQVNPLRALFRLLRLPAGGLRPLSRVWSLPPAPPVRAAGSVSRWPAAVALLAFVWLELVAPHRGDPVVVGAWLLGYAVVQLACATLRGEEWFARGDCFEVYSELAGRLSPLRHRNPLAGVAHTAAGPGLAAFLAVWWGSTIFDSASGSPAWAGFLQRAGNPILYGSAGLILLCALVLVSVRLLSRPQDLTASLIPIAVGYTLAHYLSLLLVETPRGLLLTVQQWGVAEGVEWNVVPMPGVIAGAQITLILLGHVAGVVVAHDMALRATPERPPLATLADELPVVLLMIGYTWAGLFLLFVR